MRVIISGKARNDLDSIFQYIVNDNYIAAQSTLDRISTSIENLKHNPGIGRIGRNRGTRELIVPSIPYIIPYAVEKDRIVVLRVYHSSRSWPQNI